ncbi:MAG: RNA polymerase sigma factor [Verrucomicrobiales bacterium]|nr:RNA polymerase sigma factor [Verrucomicrobiales bacterium]
MVTAADFPDDGAIPFPLRSRSASPPLHSEEDREVAAAAAGNDEAFVRLVERHQEKVFRFCCQWLVNDEDAREATQDTFVKAYLALDRYRKHGRFSTWLFQIALNQCRDRLKSKAGSQRRRTDSLKPGESESKLVCPGPSPDEAVAVAGDKERLGEAIERLPVALRAVVIICGIEGMSQETCAEILNISIRAVEGRFYRARRQLEAWLAD